MRKNIILFIGLIFLISCAKYKEHFGGRSGEYLQAEVTAPVIYPQGVKGIKPTNKYDIPDITVSDGIADLNPPDYRG